MRRIELADAAFLMAEKRETPMHVGGVGLYTLPKGVSAQEFVGFAGTPLLQGGLFGAQHLAELVHAVLRASEDQHALQLRLAQQVHQHLEALAP